MTINAPSHPIPPELQSVFDRICADAMQDFLQSVRVKSQQRDIGALVMEFPSGRIVRRDVGRR